MKRTFYSYICLYGSLCLFIACAIALTASAILSVYEEDSVKKDGWNEYISLYQALPLPEASQIIEFKIFDKASVPFDITIKYTSAKSYEDELKQYLPLLEEYQMIEIMQKEAQYECTDKKRIIHFSLDRQDTKYHLRLSNGSW